MNLNNRQVVFTNHAVDRLAEVQLDTTKGLELLAGAVKEELNKFKDQQRYKAHKYKNSPVTTHWRNGTVIFTTVEKIDDNTGEEIILVITVYDQKLNQKHVIYFDK